MDNLTTQRKQILEHLKKHGKITSMEAFGLFGCTRLSGRIYDLKAEGYTILTERTSGKSRTGHKTEYATYYLEEC